MGKSKVAADLTTKQKEKGGERERDASPVLHPDDSLKREGGFTLSTALSGGEREGERQPPRLPLPVEPQNQNKPINRIFRYF